MDYNIFILQNDEPPILLPLAFEQYTPTRTTSGPRLPTSVSTKTFTSRSMPPIPGATPSNSLPSPPDPHSHARFSSFSANSWPPTTPAVSDSANTNTSADGPGVDTGGRVHLGLALVVGCLRRSRQGICPGGSRAQARRALGEGRGGTPRPDAHVGAAVGVGK